MFKKVSEDIFLNILNTYPNLLSHGYNGNLEYYCDYSFEVYILTAVVFEKVFFKGNYFYYIRKDIYNKYCLN